MLIEVESKPTSRHCDVMQRKILEPFSQGLILMCEKFVVPLRENLSLKQTVYQILDMELKLSQFESAKQLRLLLVQGWNKEFDFMYIKMR